MSPEETPRTGRFRAKARPDTETTQQKIDPTGQIIADLVELSLDAGLIASRGQEHFLSTEGRVERHAADGILVKVQELCDRLSPSFRNAHPGVPWTEIRGTRNRIGHNYRATDYRIIWVTLTEGLPSLVGQLEE